MIMTLTYIFHSGFVLETGQSILIFDYWYFKNESKKESPRKLITYKDLRDFKLFGCPVGLEPTTFRTTI